jgi:hypothetical protein
MNNINKVFLNIIKYSELNIWNPIFNFINNINNPEEFGISFKDLNNSLIGFYAYLNLNKLLLI